PCSTPTRSRVPSTRERPPPAILPWRRGWGKRPSGHYVDVGTVSGSPVRGHWAAWPQWPETPTAGNYVPPRLPVVPRVMRQGGGPSARPRWPCLLPDRLVTAYLELVGKGHGRIPECRPPQNSIPADAGVVTVSPSLGGVRVPLLRAPGLPSPPGRVC